MKKIVLLTTRYPYGDNETFIDPELCFAKDIATIDIVPTVENLDDLELRDIPNSVNLKNLFVNRRSILSNPWYLGITIFQKSTWQELNLLRNRGKLSLYNIKRTLGFIYRGNRIYKLLEVKYKNDLINHKESIVFYSFWMMETSYAIAKIKQKYSIKAITRAHGADLYEYRQNTILPILPMRQYILSNLDKTYSISEDGMNYMIHNFGFGNKIKTSYLGTTDNDAYNIEKMDIPFVIVSCARMVPIKRINLLVQALVMIENHPIKWVHFGDGPERLKIESEMKKLPNNIEAHLMGDVHHDVVISYYKNNTVNLFINTSISEGIPVSIMEANSFGIPVIATDVGGIKEIVKNDVNGVCTSKDITFIELSDIILKFIKMDFIVYKNMRDQTRYIWKKKFNANTNYANFYRELLLGEESDG